jgi:hypothetical protein
MALEILVMSNADSLAKINPTGALGKSTLITTTHVSIPMPSGAKQPASQSNASGRSSAATGQDKGK